MKPSKQGCLDIATARPAHSRRFLRSSVRWRLVALAMLLAVALAPFAMAQKEGKRKNSNREAMVEREGADFLRRRAEWFYHQRAYPLGFIPAGARLRAIEQMREMIRARGEVLPGTRAESVEHTTDVASIPTWNPIGPAPTANPFFAPSTSGRVLSLAVDPKDASGNTVYLGAAEGGVWKTTDGGKDWTPLSDFQPSLAAASIALDSSTNPSTIYVGTGEQDFIDTSSSAPLYYGTGVLKSTDGGKTWQQLGQSTFVGPFGSGFIPGGGARIRSLAVSPDGKVLLAGVQINILGSTDGIYRSADGGQTWTNVLSGAEGTSVVFDPTPPSKPGMWTAYAALGAPAGFSVNNGVYKSTDGGQTWAAPQTLLSNPGTIDLTISQSNPSTLYAAVADASFFSIFLGGVFKTTNGGSTWTQLTGSPLVAGDNGMGFCDGQCFYDMFIRVSPTNPNLVFAGGAAVNATLIRSTDGGTSWAEVSNNQGTSTNGLHVDEHALAFSANGNIAYTGNDGGVWGTTNPTATPITWNNLNQTLQITQFYGGGSIHPSSASVGFGGTQDNGIQGYVGTPQWVETEICGDGGWTAIDSAVPSTVYIDCPPFGGPTIFKSFLNGTPNQLTVNPPVITWGPASAIDPTEPSAFIPPLVIDPTNSQTLYYGTFRVWQTLDGGNTWAAFSPNLTGFPNGSCGSPFSSPFCIVTTIAVAPSSSSVVYAGSDNSVIQLTTNAGATWTNVSAGLPPRVVTQIAVDPITPTTAYATFSGFSGFNSDMQGHVFKTTNGGTSWTDISCTAANCGTPNATDLPNIPVNDIVVDPDLPNTLYVATDVGVFETTDGGAQWSPLGMTSLPHVAVLNLKLHHPSRTLRAGTHGRGVWDLDLGNLPAFSLGGISPTTEKAGDTNNLLLTVTGTGFTGSSVVGFTVNGITDPLTPASASPTQLTVSIPPKDLGGATVAQVSVSDPTHTPNTTIALPFTLTNPPPSMTSSNPTSLTAPASADVTLTANGHSFSNNSALQLVQLATTSLTGTNVNSGGTQITGTLPKSFLAFGGTFFVIVNNPQPGGGTTNPFLDPTICCSLVVTGPVPANDNFASAANITTNAFAATEDTSGATTQASDPGPPCALIEGNAGTAKSVWFKFTTAANGNGTLEADTIGSAYDTILSVWTGTQDNLLPVVPNGCNDDIVLGVNRVSQVTDVQLLPSSTYYFMVSAFVGDGGKLVFNVNATLPPPPISVSISPASTNVAAGVTQPFTATVQNTSNTGVAWSLSGPGCTGAACGMLSNASSNPVTYTAPTTVPNPTTVTLTALSTADNSTAGTATITITPNYTTTASSPSPSSVTPGGSSMSTITLTPQMGTTPGAINLSCTTIQPATTTITCSFSPNPTNVGNSAATSTLTLRTTANSALPPVSSGRPKYLPLFASWLAAMMLLVIVARKESRWRKLVFGVASAMLLAFLFFQAACGGGGGGGPTPSGGTPPGTYTITVAGTPPGTGAPTAITLTVQ